ncbi:hypothetical protein L208DRAFT_134420 [Tricholoma matsutake]|nr:hypothetical protein L208DRAFT_134420 [Tricholoma matsutake 945]
MLSRCILSQYFACKAKHAAVGSHFIPYLAFLSCPQNTRYSSPLRNSRLSLKFFSAQNSSQGGPSSDSNSIFSSAESAWDHVFTDIDEMPPLPSTMRNHLRSSPSRPRRPQAMTAREINAFDEMFNMIFDAVAEEKTASNSGAIDDSNIGVGRGGISDLFGKLRRHSKKLKWTTESDELLDRKKEAMDMCESDQQLLEWALLHVFQESERYEKAARQAISEAAKSGAPQELPMLQPPTYPHLVALLMRAFRDKYNDPNLALAIFDHARHLSIASYVFGCSTHAYNELIETRWKCFHDVKGVHDALEEMAVNGVDVDSRTRKLAETVRREIGQRNLWTEESELGSGEVWNMLARIDKLLAKPASFKKANYPRKSIRWDEWKALPLADNADDNWGFDQWKKPKRRKVQRGASELTSKTARNSTFGLTEA